MKCNYEETKCEKIISILILPLVLAGLGFCGTNTANRISKDHNKAMILKEFLGTLIDGSPGEKIIARIALKPYLDDEDLRQIDWGLRTKFEEKLYEAYKLKDLNAAQEAAVNYKTVYPKAYDRLIKYKYSEKEDTSFRKILDAARSDQEGKVFFDKALRFGNNDVPPQQGK